ncbi:MAG: Bug family tripartite tricarboxylate transporter substrate binding protein [Elstera sp.]
MKVTVTGLLRGIMASASALTLTLALPAAAQSEYPNRPIRFLVGFPAGGASDFIARIVAGEMSKSLGQQVVIENKPGASGNIATQAMLSAPADGYTLVFAAIHFATNPAMMAVGYEPLKDLTLVSQISSVPVLMLTSPKTGYTTVGDVIKAAKAKKDGVPVGSGGLGTSSHLALELLARNSNFPFTHVPYRGGGPAMQALMAGEVDVTFDLMSGALRSNIEGKTIVPIAVMQDKRVPSLPSIPSIGEQGIGPESFIRSWQGVAVKTGTAPAVVAKLHKAVVDAVAVPEAKAKIEQLGADPITSATPQDFQRHYETELARWGDLIRKAGIKAE